jgi:hypothetical protein
VSDAAGSIDDPRFHAVLDLCRRMGARQVHIRYQDDQQPVMWLVGVEVPQQDGWGWDCAGAMTPLLAAMRLAEQVTDGGRCAHCGRATGLWMEWEQKPPFDLMMCWYIYDPELQKFRRSCEGETSGRLVGRDPKTGKIVRRNDPCPCGSGEKWKRCHGRAQ